MSTELARYTTVEQQGDTIITRRPVTYGEIAKRCVELERQRKERQKTHYQKQREQIQREIAGPKPQSFRFHAPAHHFNLVLEAARVSGVRLTIAGLPGDLFTVSDTIDWSVGEKTVVQRKLGKNEVVYDALARDADHFSTFGDCYDIDLTHRRDLWEAPKDGPGFWWTNPVGRALSGKWRGFGI